MHNGVLRPLRSTVIAVSIKYQLMEMVEGLVLSTLANEFAGDGHEQKPVCG